MRTLKIVNQRLEALKPYPRNARTHSKKQIRQIAESIETFGWTNPVLVDASGGIIAGHGRVEAAKRLGLAQVPTSRIEDLSKAEKRAYKEAKIVIESWRRHYNAVRPHASLGYGRQVIPMPDTGQRTSGN